MTNNLVKSEIVVPLHLATDKSASFVLEPEEEGGYFLYMTTDLQRWDDMGRPSFITVTIRPGDQLNKEQEDE